MIFVLDLLAEYQFHSLSHDRNSDFFVGGISGAPRRHPGAPGGRSRGSCTVSAAADRSGHLGEVQLSRAATIMRDARSTGIFGQFPAHRRGRPVVGHRREFEQEPIAVADRLAGGAR